MVAGLDVLVTHMPSYDITTKAPFSLAACRDFPVRAGALWPPHSTLTTTTSVLGRAVVPAAAGPAWSTCLIWRAPVPTHTLSHTPVLLLACAAAGMPPPRATGTRRRRGRHRATHTTWLRWWRKRWEPAPAVLLPMQMVLQLPQDGIRSGARMERGIPQC